MSNTVYSSDENDWSWCSESIEETAFQYIQDNGLEPDSNEIVLYKGTEVKSLFRDFLNVPSFIEGIQQKAHDRVGDVSSGWLTDVDEAQEKELENLILGWVASNNLEPDFFEVVEVKEVTYEVNRMNTISLWQGNLLVFILCWALFPVFIVTLFLFWACDSITYGKPFASKELFLDWQHGSGISWLLKKYRGDT